MIVFKFTIGKIKKNEKQNSTIALNVSRHKLFSELLVGSRG